MQPNANINDETLHDNLFELLDEDIVEAAPSFNLIDEENDGEELENYNKKLKIL